MNKTTYSENLFEQYCKDRKYNVKKLAEEEDRTPDYKVETPKGIFICEVTQLEPNEEDKKWFAEVMKNGGSWNGSRPCSEISKEIRKRLNRKIRRNQLQPHSEEGCPTLLVLFDATTRFYLDGFSLDGAMYGDQHAWISSDPKEPTIVEHGGNRQFRKNEENKKRNLGSYISAVAILHSTPSPSLEVVHNFFADIPFPPSLLPDPSDKHWIKPIDPHTPFQLSK